MMEAIQPRENDLRRLTLLNRTILDNVDFGIISTTPEGVVTSFNPAAERLLGYTAEEIVGEQTPECWHDKDEIERHARQLTDEIGETIPSGFEVFSARPTQTLWTLVSASPIFDEEHRCNGSFAMLTDITERKLAEEGIKVLNL